MPDAAFSVRREIISAARRDLGLSLPELWLAYIAVGGDESPTLLRAWMEGTTDIPDRDYDYLAQGLNDRFVERGLGYFVAYSDEIRDADRPRLTDRYG